MTLQIAPCAAAVLALLATGPALASAQQETPSTDTLPAYALEAVVVTSTRAPAARHRVPQKIEVVTATDLARSVGSDVTDALKENAGVDVIQYPGLLSGVAIRGFRPQFSGINPRTLILLDGRPAGATNLATLDLSAVERIEVLKGPASALYGSSAMGGVVNVVTRSTSGPVRGRVDAGYGTAAAYRAELTAGGTLAPALDFDLSLAAAGREAGYRVGRNRLLAPDSVTKSLSAGGTVRLAEVSPDTVLTFSEYATRSGGLRLAYAPHEHVRIHARGGLFRGEDVENPGDLTIPSGLYDPRTLNDLERATLEAGAAGELGRHALSLRGFLSRETTAYYDDPLAPSFVSFRTPIRWYGAQLQDVVSLGAHRLTAGLDYTTARAASERFTAAGVRGAPYSPNSAIHSAAAFAETRLGLLDDRLVATVGGRLDRVSFEVEQTELFDFAGEARSRANSETRVVFNPSLGLLYAPGAGVRLHATAGRAFVSPDAFHVAGYAETRPGDRRAVRIARGNPALEPESSVSWDAGLGIFRPRLGLEADLTYFHTGVRDRIVSRLVVPPAGETTPAGDTVLSVLTYANADEAEIRGIEGRLSYDLGARAGHDYSLRLFASGTRILRARETTGTATSDIRNVADLTVVSGVEFDDLERFGARLGARYVGRRVDADYVDWMNPGEIRYPAFLVLDLAADLRLGDRYRLGLTIDNLTDENYYEVRGYNLPGRTVMVRVGVGLF